MTPATATENVLDNVVWHALRGPQASLAEWSSGRRAVRYDQEVAIFGAVDRLDEEGWRALADLVGPGGVTILFREAISKPPPGWDEVFRGPTWQLVAGDVSPPPEGLAIEVLSASDAEEMFALTKLTEPGPFFARTHEMGTYVGIRHEGRLVAMAGERMQAPGYTEISAVCSHPDVRRRGYGAALTAWMVDHIRKRGDAAYLHVLEDNENALRLYESIGFQRRRLVDAVAAVRIDQDIK